MILKTIEMIRFNVTNFEPIWKFNPKNKAFIRLKTGKMQKVRFGLFFQLITQ